MRSFSCARAGAVLALAVLAACSGNANTSSSFVPASPTASGAAPNSALAVAVATPSPAHIVVDGIGTSLYVAHDTSSTVCGKFHVTYTSATTFAPRKPNVGDVIAVTGNGNCSTGYAATAVTIPALMTPTPSPTPTPTPKPTATPMPKPTASPVTQVVSSGGTISAFQIFDEFYTTILNSAKVTDGSRYSTVWGATAPTYWTQQSATKASYYIPMETDFSVSNWGGIGHSLSWWQANHPDWVLYSCDSTGKPTTQLTYISGWNGQVPLDIHNPAVVSYLANTAAAYAKAHGYNAIAVDEVLLFNLEYNKSTGLHSCGIYQNGSFVQRYSTNQDDPAWANDVVAWVKQAKSIFAANGLPMIVNSPHTSSLASTTADYQVVTNTNYDLDETGFTDYGKYTTLETLFASTLNWTVQAQKLGTWVLVNNEFSGTTALTPVQREYSIATYLLANEGKLSLFSGPANSYGGEMYYSEYTRSYGSACADASATGTVYSRRLQNAYVVLNSSATATSVTLPAGHIYTDLEGRPVSNPLPLSSHDAHVLLTTGGCS